MFENSTHESFAPDTTCIAGAFHFKSTNMQEHIPQNQKTENGEGHSLHQASLLAAARDYLARGWPVIPLIGKLPTVSWKEYQSRLPGLEELTTWFDGNNLPTGIGVVTGRVSGLVVVDCDSLEDAEYWTGEHGLSSLVAETGGGGVHIYYAMPKETEVRNRARLFGRKIDIRGEGGYVTAPPSLHPNGSNYVWQSADIQCSLPRFDAGWLTPEHQEQGLPLTASTVKVRKAVAYISRIQAVAGEGGHNATFRAACKLRDAGFSEEEALLVLSDWNKTNASPPWSAEELAHKIHSAFKR